MYDKEEAKQMRIDFWQQFTDYTNNRRKNKGRTGKWIMDKTGINAINLKFHFDQKMALVGIDVETKNLDTRIAIYEKLESLKEQINKALGENTLWEVDYIRENDKSISRVYTAIDNVDIFDKTSWNRVNMFFFDRMTALEDMFLEYRDILR
ncbi:MAG: DUF4268 domain-containing protein [Bacteroidales bacterium]|jgi:translation elongation factor EF-Ts|nr:DUF4268 domain-containing protein [Bacteroidales bacterium]